MCVVVILYFCSNYRVLEGSNWKENLTRMKAGFIYTVTIFKQTSTTKFISWTLLSVMLNTTS